MTGDHNVLRDLERALNVVPSPGFEARVRARIAAEPARTRWTWTAGAAAAAAVILAVMLIPRPTPVETDRRLDMDAAVSVSLPTASTPAVLVAPAQPVVRTHPTSPGVVVPRGQAAAIQRLVTAATTNRVAMLPARPEQPDELQIAAVMPPEPLVVKAIEVRPLWSEAQQDVWR